LRTTLVRLCLTWHKRHAMEVERLAAIAEPAETGEPIIDAYSGSAATALVAVPNDLDTVQVSQWRPGPTERAVSH